ncbi:hypothetical protein [Micromonospora aurantiaca (nom. illeg.)]|uniref:hypothetical protein n=1 Tax=Micromonospora aurantiaca (nom. illeg.) TaxID=47850 RepID=UPI0011A53C99|nr:hypothetical protein [Micromonospora aurantiaca]MBC9005166.1 hypothetical protein [Micromonospora aurantiaca]
MTAGSFTVFVSWQGSSTVAAVETREPLLDWPSARSLALRLACCNGARYVTVQGPGAVVVGDWDRYTNRWREYALHVGVCDNDLEPDGEPCGGQLYAKPSDVQVRCPRCGGWTGYRARGMRQPFEAAA